MTGFTFDAEGKSLGDAHRIMAGLTLALADTVANMGAVYEHFDQLNETQPAGFSSVIAGSLDEWGMELRVVAGDWLKTAPDERPCQIEARLRAAGFRLMGGGSGPDFFAYEAESGAAHIIATAQDGGLPRFGDWIVAVYRGPINDGQNEQLFCQEAGDGQSLGGALARALEELARVPAPRYVANLVHVGGVYRDGKPIAFCRGDDVSACVAAIEIAAAMNRAGG